MDSKKSNKRPSSDALFTRNSKKSRIASSNSVFPTQKQFRQTCLPQKFSLPIPIMKYIWENPSSPKAYQKLIQCCKFFFIKKSILVVSNLRYCGYINGWRYCSAEKCNLVCCFTKSKEIDFDKIKEKIWLTGKFCVGPYYLPNLLSNLAPKISQCHIQKLEIFQQHLTYDMIKLLTSGVEECVLGCNFVKYDNGEEVPLENIIQLFSNCRKITMHFDDNYFNATCKSYDDFINACGSIKEIYLHRVPNTFNIYEFYQHLKNSKNRTLIRIHSITSQHRLNDVIDEILQTESFDFVPLSIDFFRPEDKAKYLNVFKIQETVVAKYC